MNPEDLLNESLGAGKPDDEKEKKESPLVSLRADLKYYSESIREVSREIIREGLSEHPVFIAHQHEVKMGEVILDKDELSTDWTIHASTVEEFVERGVIKPILKERFLSSYKDPDTFICLFVVVPEGANFVYFPYEKE